MTDDLRTRIATAVWMRYRALKIVVSQGCTCQACGAFWAPEKFLFLGRLLGYDVPEGVLE